MRAWQVFKIWGIPFKIHPSWVALLFLFAWNFSSQLNLSSEKIYSFKESWLIGFITSFLLLSSIFFSQIFHTYISLNNGVKIRNITFVFLGAILKTEKECKDAIGNIKIAITRPTFFLITYMVLTYLTNVKYLKESILIDIISKVDIFYLFLGLFNLLPFGSLDGGNLFKSIIWYVTGSRNKGRNLLNKMNFFVSILILICGIFCLLNSINYAFLLLILGLIGINSSKSESQYFKIEKILKESKISDLKLIPLRKLDAGISFKEFNKVFKRNNESFNHYYFLTNNGRWDGFITSDTLKSIPVKKWETSFVGQYKKLISDFPKEKEHTPLWKIVEGIEKTTDGILLIENTLGIPLGIVDRNKIGYYILNSLGINLSIDIIKKIKTKNNYPLGIELPKYIELMKIKGDID